MPDRDHCERQGHKEEVVYQSQLLPMGGDEARAVVRITEEKLKNRYGMSDQREYAIIRVYGDNGEGEGECLLRLTDADFGTTYVEAEKHAIAFAERWLARFEGA